MGMKTEGMGIKMKKGRKMKKGMKMMMGMGMKIIMMGKGEPTIIRPMKTPVVAPITVSPVTNPPILPLPTEQPTVGDTTIFDIVIREENLSTLERAIQVAKLDTILLKTKQDSFTLFAPVNTAFLTFEQIV